MRHAMHETHPAHVLLGGVAAGLIILVGEYLLNAILLGDLWADLRASFGIPVASNSQYAIGGILTLSYGVVLIWLYAAMRPRFESDTGTALVAAATFWFIAYVLFLLSVWANGFVTIEIAAFSIAWGVVEVPVAALVGARIYRSGMPSST